MEARDMVGIAVNILTLVVISISVLIALGIGVGSFLHTNYLQRKEFERAEQVRQKDRRDKLLDEIAHWATDCLKCTLTPIDPAGAATVSGSPGSWVFISASLLSEQSSLLTLIGMSNYMVLSASRLSSDLHAAVRQLTDNAQALQKSISRLLNMAQSQTPDRVADFKAAGDEQSKYAVRLHNSAVKVLVETVNLKTQDLPKP